MRLKAKRTIQQLFQDFAAIMVELRQRNVVRSTNNPVADYAEFLVCKALKLKRAPGSTKGYDAKDKRGRRLTVENPSRQLSAIRDMEGEHFDFLAIVLFAPDFSVTRACVVSAAKAKAAAQYRKHVNAWIIHACDSLFNQAGARDITEQVRQVSNDNSHGTVVA